MTPLLPKVAIMPPKQSKHVVTPKKPLVEIVKQPPKQKTIKQKQPTTPIVVPVTRPTPIRRKTIKNLPATKHRSIKLSTTAKRRIDAIEKFKNDVEVVSINAIKNKLIGAGLITANSRAPEEVLRDIYKNHALSGGSILVTRPHTSS